ncbi:hypothetical protein [Devosia sp. Root635]|uniref:hypothetical protein n=1 Tax=Devosia sp. Root635 TaxID=1736575 RepID=UPI0007012774|nr:hypothetical protein [Devosia sp. Root635]KRA42282.1 hypothetical protein ASD80_11260 [Devosia sp. Root635]
MHQTRNIGREIGTAFAVLAIYLLTVLAPMHHARASQLAFEELGYATIEASWVLCTPSGIDSQDKDAPVAKCPATGVGKTELVLPMLDAVPVSHEIALAAPLSIPLPAFLPRAIAPPSGPRAPPVSI